LAACGSYFNSASPDTYTGGPCPAGFFKTAHWDLFFTDGHETRDLTVTEPGRCIDDLANSPVLACYPGFNNPIWMETTVGVWNQVTTNPRAEGSSDQGWHCIYTDTPFKDHIFTYVCRAQCRGTTDYGSYSSGCFGGFADLGGTCGRPQSFVGKCYERGEEYSNENCSCRVETPILIDVNGDGFALTDAAHGVSFDLKADGVPKQLAWTSAGADDAFLVLDRNGNGTIDDGKELFGDVTFQPAAPEGEEHNGFIALAMLDSPDQGGNSDGKISSEDRLFASLRLWQDVDHNGHSEATELHSLSDLGLKSIDLDYKTSKRTDQYGNRFRYRAKVKDTRDAQSGRWAWDVVFAQ